MTFNISLNSEQSQREDNDKAAVEAQIESNGKLFTDGKFDGVTGEQPKREFWDKYPYRDGYLIGITKHYDRKYQIDMGSDLF